MTQLVEANSLLKPEIVNGDVSVIRFAGGITPGPQFNVLTLALLNEDGNIQESEVFIESGKAAPKKAPPHSKIATPLASFCLLGCQWKLKKYVDQPTESTAVIQFLLDGYDTFKMLFRDAEDRTRFVYRAMEESAGYEGGARYRDEPLKSSHATDWVIRWPNRIGEFVWQPVRIGVMGHSPEHELSTISASDLIFKFGINQLADVVNKMKKSGKGFGRLK